MKYSLPTRHPLLRLVFGLLAMGAAPMWLAKDARGTEGGQPKETAEATQIVTPISIVDLQPFRQSSSGTISRKPGSLVR